MLKTSNITGFRALSVTNICYQLEGHQLINNLSFTLTTPGITAIMGPNGAGKSLTLRLLHGLIQPTSGRIDWQLQGAAALRRAEDQQAMVFQKPVLLRRSVIENLRYTLKVRGIRSSAAQQPLLETALDMARLREKTKIPARRLSGGEQQRLALARALMLRPEILLLDEPTSSLDPASTAAIEQLILGARDGGTKIILVSHDIGQAKRLADEILFLDNGSVSEQGPAEQLLQNAKSRPARQYFNGELVLAS